MKTNKSGHTLNTISFREGIAVDENAKSWIADAEGQLSPTLESQDTLISILSRLERRVESIESGITELRDCNSIRSISKESYCTAEIARILNKRPYTVREWCRLGRIRATKTHMGRGIEKEWRITHEELVRIQNEGLLPYHGVRLSVGRVTVRR